MKKTYITPAFFAVELGSRKNVMLTASETGGNQIITSGGDGNGTDIGAKGVSDVNVWDEEW